MDLPNILNNRGASGVAMANGQHMQHYADLTGRAMSDTGSERGMSPHLSDRGHYIRPNNHLHGLNMGNVGHQDHFSLVSNPYPTPTNSIEGGYTHTQDDQLNTPVSDSQIQTKAFACSSCGKGFARRSDLARHERIHTGVRPHVCNHPGCGKQFIQRSALTVHTRVHTGEKPHMCEHCTKPFSDSSSLARHRRIHSGKRPYKCPYANCQKTFTRRTTLTRHQSHHTGTVEESKAQADAVFANRTPHRIKTEGLAYSDAGSSRSSPSSDRHLSHVHTPDMAHAQMLPRQNDFSYMSGLPPHLRHHDMSQNSPRSGSSSPSLSGFGLSSRPSFTSHPNAYAPPPPPPLEPPTQMDHRGSGSQGGSPHMGSIGWQTPPQHQTVGSPMAGNGYVYPDPAYDLSAANLYYGTHTQRRTQSAEPDQYDMKSRMTGNEVWATQMS